MHVGNIKIINKISIELFFFIYIQPLCKPKFTDPAVQKFQFKLYLLFSKVVLCASSPYFAKLLSGTSPSDHPVIILNDVQFSHLSIIMDFIYRGSVNVPHDMVDTINQVANLLAIRGIVSKESNTNVKQVG